MKYTEEQKEKLKKSKGDRFSKRYIGIIIKDGFYIIESKMNYE